MRILVGLACTLAGAFLSGCGAPLTEHGRYLVDVYDSQTIERYCFLSPGLLVVLALVILVATRIGRRHPGAASRFAAWCTARERPLVLTIALASAAFSGWLAVGPLESLPHIQDERAYLFQARLFAGGHLAAPVPPPPLDRAASLDFTVQDPTTHRWYGRFPPGWPAALALATLTGYPQLLNPLLTVLALIALHLFVRTLTTPGRALATTALAAASPLVTFNGGSHMPHLFGVLLLLATYRGSGLAAGLLFLTRPHEGALAALYLIVSRAPLRWLAPFAICVALNFGYNAAQTGSALTPPTLKFYAGDRPGFHADAGVYRAEGHNLARALHNQYVQLRITSDVLFGWPLVSLVPALLGLLGGSRFTAGERLHLAIATLYLLVLFSFHNPGIGHGSRFHVFLLPVLLWLTARGLAVLAARDAAAVMLAVAYLTIQSLVLHYPQRIADVRGYWGVTRVAVSGRPIVLVPPATVDGEELFDAFEAISVPWPDSGGPVALRLAPGVADAAPRAFPGRSLMMFKHPAPAAYR